MVFSYSCSCRNDSTGPGNDGNGGNGGGSGNDNTPIGVSLQQLIKTIFMIYLLEAKEIKNEML